MRDQHHAARASGHEAEGAAFKLSADVGGERMAVGSIAHRVVAGRHNALDGQRVDVGVAHGSGDAQRAAGGQTHSPAHQASRLLGLGLGAAAIATAAAAAATTTGTASAAAAAAAASTAASTAAAAADPAVAPGTVAEDQTGGGAQRGVGGRVLGLGAGAGAYPAAREVQHTAAAPRPCDVARRPCAATGAVVVVLDVEVGAQRARAEAQRDAGQPRVGVVGEVHGLGAARAKHCGLGCAAIHGHADAVDGGVGVGIGISVGVLVGRGRALWGCRQRCRHGLPAAALPQLAGHGHAAQIWRSLSAVRDGHDAAVGMRRRRGAVGAKPERLQSQGRQRHVPLSRDCVQQRRQAGEVPVAL